MLRNPSWKINESFKMMNNKYDEIIRKSIQYTNELNEEDTSTVHSLLEEASLRGWYPFVSEIYNNPNNIHKYEYIIDIQKDETIFELLMLEAEVDILSEFSDIDLESFKNRIKVAKGML